MKEKKFSNELRKSIIEEHYKHAYIFPHIVKLRGSPAMAGMPDLCLTAWGRTFFIETKVKEFKSSCDIMALFTGIQRATITQIVSGGGEVFGAIQVSEAQGIVVDFRKIFMSSGKIPQSMKIYKSFSDDQMENIVESFNIPFAGGAPAGFIIIRDKHGRWSGVGRLSNETI